MHIRTYTYVYTYKYTYAYMDIEQNIHIHRHIGLREFPLFIFCRVLLLLLGYKVKGIVLV